MSTCPFKISSDINKMHSVSLFHKLTKLTSLTIAILTLRLIVLNDERMLNHKERGYGDIHISLRRTGNSVSTFYLCTPFPFFSSSHSVIVIVVLCCLLYFGRSPAAIFTIFGTKGT